MYHDGSVVTLRVRVTAVSYCYVPRWLSCNAAGPCDGSELLLCTTKAQL